MALALNTTIVASAKVFTAGISKAFIVDGVLAVIGTIVAILLIADYKYK